MTVRGLKLDASNDVVHDGKRLQLVSDREAIAQAIRTRLQFFQGEWWLDEAFGTPYFQTILGTKVPPAAIREVFRQVIADTAGVAEVQKLQLTESTPRNYTLSFTVTTDLDELIVDTVPVGVP